MYFKFNGGKFLKNIFKRNASTVLTFASLAGLVGTIVLMVKGKGKADEELSVAENQKGELTKFEKTVIAAPYYIPGIAMAVGTGICMLSANALARKQSATLVAAYGLLESTLRGYKKRIGEEGCTVIDSEIIKEELVKEDEKLVELYSDEDCDENVKLFYEPYTRTYFNATEEFVKDAYLNLNRSLAHKQYAGLSEFINFLDLDEYNDSTLTDVLGWEESTMILDWDKRWIDVTWEKTVLDDGMEPHILSYYPVPTIDETLFPQAREYF